jgi:hypothetical protein
VNPPVATKGLERYAPGQNCLVDVQGEHIVVYQAEKSKLDFVISHWWMPRMSWNDTLRERRVKRNSLRSIRSTTRVEDIYEERAFDRLPLLADAMEEAGCSNDDILSHLRSGGLHVRGCWVVDLILGKS